MYLSFHFFPAETLAREGEEVAFSLPPQTILLIVLVALPLVVMINSLEIAICIFACSFKEAQNYIMPLQFAVLIPAVPLMMMPDLALPLAAYATPIVGALLSFSDLLKGAASGAALGLTVASSVIYAAICLSVAVHIFRREGVLFRAA
jgi:sodium transport system permease protein